LQRLIVSKALKELSPEDGQQEKEQDSNFEIIGMCRSYFGKVVKTAGEHHSAANHPRDLEIRQALVIEHSIKFQQPNHSEHADQQPKQDLVSGEHDQQRDCPKRDRADEPQNENGTGRDHVSPGLLQRCRHAPASSRRKARRARVERTLRRDRRSAYAPSGGTGLPSARGSRRGCSRLAMPAAPWLQQCYRGIETVKAFTAANAFSMRAGVSGRMWTWPTHFRTLAVSPSTTRQVIAQF